MGDYADMVLEGILDEETGEYIGEENKERYGSEAPGFPISLQREAREATGAQGVKVPVKERIKKLPCPICKKNVKPLGLSDHIRHNHWELI